MNKVIIVSPCGNHEWQAYSDNVPRAGEQVTCRSGRLHDIEFSGIVDSVHYEVRKGFGVNEGNSKSGMIVTVWLKEDEDG